MKHGLAEARESRHRDIGALADLTEAGRLWVEAIDKLADMDEHTPERRATRNTMLGRLDDLEAVFRRILRCEK